MSALPPLALAYHGVARVPLRQDVHALFVPPKRLAHHIRLLRRWGYELVTFSELARRVGAGAGAGVCALTFDDALADDLLEVLAPEAVTATVFAVSGWMAERHPDAAWATTRDAAGLRALAAEGIEVGSHSASHRDLSTLAYADVLADLRSARHALVDLLGQPVDVLAYPFGRANDDTVRACREAGYAAACLTSGHGSWTDPYRLPRQDMGNDSTDLGLRLKRDDRYERLVSHPLGRAVRAAVRRVKALAS